MRFLVLAGAPALLVMAGCGGSGEADPDEDTSSSLSASWFTVKVTTSSGSIGRNHDDRFCAWVGTSYVLRDDDGGIVAEGDAESRVEGKAEANGEPAQIGKVTSLDPYECVMDFRVEEVPRGEFFELEVSTESVPDGEEFTEKVVLSREDLDSVVKLEFTQ
ncbi:MULTISPECIES: hypothetical protein [Nocardiopsis]|uniref:hypothetical protein n=1 Tax=Nocardiopsis TaxID=2013 RepID=UPI0003465165|nr:MULTISPECIES: hypothetical protein [Nocardiopsis]